jgi:HlyD family secretion protein
MMKRHWMLVAGFMVLSLGLSGCANSGKAQSGLSASGTIYAEQVAISPEMNEKVHTVNVLEGQKVLAGEVLFTQDDAILKVQFEQAQAQVSAAEATLQAAEAQLVSGQAQYDLTLAGAYLQDNWKSTNLWQMEVLEETGLPAWYYQKYEYLDAIVVEEEAALLAVAREQANLDKVLMDVSNYDFVAAEKRLVEMQVYYQALKTTRDQAEAAQDGAEVREAADDLYQEALTDLEAAKLAYNRILSSEAAIRVREARARLAVVQARLDYARSVKSQMQTGDDSLQVKAARAQVQQAETAVTQAQANLQQAQSGLRVIELQLERAVVVAPVDGTILARNLEVGEFVAAGSVVMTIGKLDEVRLVVYVPEDQYGRIKLEQSVQVSVDSYPGRIFNGSVVKIADQAEFTPRNVSTEEGRKSTVFAVEIFIPNPDGALKPGMPADVVFG